MSALLAFSALASVALILLGLYAAKCVRGQRATLAKLAAEVQRRERAEEALRQAQKMEAVGRLTGGIAHDFNNHLTVISSNVELLQRRLAADAEGLHRLADSALQGVRRAATLTSRLLAFSRQQPPDPEPVDAGRLVQAMSDLLRRTLGETIAIETVLAGGLWQTRIDASQLENALLNLAVNARDAMPHGGTLTIATSNIQLDETCLASSGAQPGQYVGISVTDTGTGMPARTVAPALTTGALGAGFGLSMVHGFVRQSGGHVDIRSEPGHGGTIRVLLPRFVRHEPPRAAASLPAASLAAGETILVVEDDEHVRRATVEGLREIGYTVLEAPDAMEAFRLILDRGGIDLLFTDVGLPGGVNGRALADAARDTASGLKVLFTTGYTSDATFDTGALGHGMHFLAKPFDLRQLAAKIREVLDEPRPEHAGTIEALAEDYADRHHH